MILYYMNTYIYGLCLTLPGGIVTLKLSTRNPVIINDISK